MDLGNTSVRPQRRADIQGLRAVAVSLVLVFHLWPTSLPGGFVGVDVFFVISGFLITTHLLATGPSCARDIGAFWVRRVRRLLPAAILVLLVTLGASRLFGPDGRWKHTALEVIASAVDLENWALAYRAVDYLNAAAPPSPVQHYWSLSVEEQFYVAWPILILVVFYVSRRLCWHPRSVATAIFVILFTLSLACSYWLTQSHPAQAFFATPTRIWELAAGGILAAWLYKGSVCARATSRLKSRSLMRQMFAWTGVISIFFSAVIYGAATPWPGVAALLPVAGTCLFIWSNSSGPRSPGLVLELRPIQFLGNVSYSIYLWHWPIIVLLPSATARDLTGMDKLLVLGASVGLAGLTKRFVEDPFLRPQAKRVRFEIAGPLAFGACGILLVVAVAGAQIHEVQKLERQGLVEIEAALSDPCFGAGVHAAMGHCATGSTHPILPSTLSAISDRPAGWDSGCLMAPPFRDFRDCTYGPSDSAVSIALVGNSHAAQWLPALQALAESKHWKVSTFLAASCPATAGRYPLRTSRESEQCMEWGREVQRRTIGAGFDLIVTSAATNGFGPLDRTAGFYEEQRLGYGTYLDAWAGAGEHVLVVRDTPLPAATGIVVPDCLAIHESDYLACSGTRQEWLRPDPLFEAAERKVGSTISIADFTDGLCPDGRCMPVIGRAVVYFDSSHMSATFARSLSSALAPHVTRAVATEPS